ncbi:hypothetical protein [Saccharothrix yanglingensis]|uniref:hypothetical protein n=1 Tax=Saccharothrix yanglingensis TaxID=659496 RepID=UPI0027D222DF|nr:hypothetical protein [Saccharothrix yanglingensis]
MLAASGWCPFACLRLGLHRRVAYLDGKAAQPSRQSIAVPSPIKPHDHAIVPTVELANLR